MDLIATELSLPIGGETECNSCLVYQKKMKNWMQWKRFYHSKLENQDKLLHLVASLEREKQQYLKLQLAYDQRTREMSYAREQVSNMLLEIEPLRERVASVEQTLESEKKLRQAAEEEVYSLTFFNTQLHHKIKMLQSKVNLNLIETLERKLKLARKDIKYLKCQLDEKSCHISELKESRRSLHENHLRIRKKAAWSLRLAWNYGNEIIKLGKHPDDMTEEPSWSKLLSHLEVLEKQLESHYKAYRKRQELQLKEEMVTVAILPSQEEWVKDFEEDYLEDVFVYDEEKVKVEGKEADDDAKKLENLLQCIEDSQNNKDENDKVDSQSKEGSLDSTVIFGSSPVKIEPQNNSCGEKVEDTKTREQSVSRRGRRNKKTNEYKPKLKENNILKKTDVTNCDSSFNSEETGKSAICNQRKITGKNQVPEERLAESNLCDVEESGVKKNRKEKQDNPTSLGDFPHPQYDDTEGDTIMSILNKMRAPPKLLPLTSTLNECALAQAEEVVDDRNEGLANVIEDLGLLSDSSDEVFENSTKKLMKQESEEFVVDSQDLMAGKKLFGDDADVKYPRNLLKHNFHSSVGFSFDNDELVSELRNIDNKGKEGKLDKLGIANEDSSSTSECIPITVTENSKANNHIHGENKEKAGNHLDSSVTDCMLGDWSEVCLSEDSDHDVIALNEVVSKESSKNYYTDIGDHELCNNSVKDMGKYDPSTVTEENLRESKNERNNKATVCHTVSDEDVPKLKSLNDNIFMKESCSESLSHSSVLVNDELCEIETSFCKNMPLKKEFFSDDVQIQERNSITSPLLDIVKGERYSDTIVSTQQITLSLPQKEQPLLSKKHARETDGSLIANKNSKIIKPLRRKSAAHSLFSSESEDVEDFTCMDYDHSLHEHKESTTGFIEVNEQIRDVVQNSDSSQENEIKGSDAEYTVFGNCQSVNSQVDERISNAVSVSLNISQLMEKKEPEHCEGALPVLSTKHQNLNRKGSESMVEKDNNGFMHLLSEGSSVEENGNFIKDTTKLERDFKLGNLQSSAKSDCLKTDEHVTGKVLRTSNIEVEPRVVNHDFKSCDIIEELLAFKSLDPPLSPIDDIEKNPFTVTNTANNELLNGACSQGNEILPATTNDTSSEILEKKRQDSRNIERYRYSLRNRKRVIDTKPMVSETPCVNIGLQENDNEQYREDLLSIQTQMQHFTAACTQKEYSLHALHTRQTNDIIRVNGNLIDGMPSEESSGISSQSRFKDTEDLLCKSFIQRQSSTGFIPVDIDDGGKLKKSKVVEGDKEVNSKEIAQVKGAPNRISFDQVSNIDASSPKTDGISCKQTSKGDPCCKTLSSNHHNDGHKAISSAVQHPSPKNTFSGFTADTTEDNSDIVKHMHASATDCEQDNLQINATIDCNGKTSLTSEIFQMKTKDEASKDRSGSQFANSSCMTEDSVQKLSNGLHESVEGESVTNDCNNRTSLTSEIVEVRINDASDEDRSRILFTCSNGVVENELNLNSDPSDSVERDRVNETETDLVPNEISEVTNFELSKAGNTNSINPSTAEMDEMMCENKESLSKKSNKKSFNKKKSVFNGQEDSEYCNIEDQVTADNSQAHALSPIDCSEDLTHTVIIPNFSPKLSVNDTPTDTGPKGLDNKRKKDKGGKVRHSKRTTRIGEKINDKGIIDSQTKSCTENVANTQKKQVKEINTAHTSEEFRTGSSNNTNSDMPLLERKDISINSEDGNDGKQEIYVNATNISDNKDLNIKPSDVVPRIQFNWGRLKPIQKKNESFRKTTFLLQKKILREIPDKYNTLPANVFSLELRNSSRKQINTRTDVFEYACGIDQEKTEIIREHEENVFRTVQDMPCKRTSIKSSSSPNNGSSVSPMEKVCKRKDKRLSVSVSKKRRVIQNLFLSESSEEELTLCSRRMSQRKRISQNNKHVSDGEENENIIENMDSGTVSRRHVTKLIRNQHASSDSTEHLSSSSRLSPMSSKTPQRQRRTTSVSSYGSIRTSVSEGDVVSPSKVISERILLSNEGDTCDTDFSDDEVFFRRKHKMKIVVTSDSEGSENEITKNSLKKRRRLAEIERRKPNRNQSLKTSSDNRSLQRLYSKKVQDRLSLSSKSKERMERVKNREQNVLSHKDIACHREDIKEDKFKKTNKRSSSEKRKCFSASHAQATEIAVRLSRQYNEIHEKKRTTILLDSSHQLTHVPKNKVKEEKQTLGKIKSMPLKSAQYYKSYSDEEMVMKKASKVENQNLGTRLPITDHSDTKANVLELDESCISTSDDNMVIDAPEYDSHNTANGSEINISENSQELCTGTVDNNMYIHDSHKTVKLAPAGDHAAHPGIISSLAKLGTLDRPKAVPKKNKAVISAHIPASSDYIERLFSFRSPVSKQNPNAKIEHEPGIYGKETLCGNMQHGKELVDTQLENMSAFDGARTKVPSIDGFHGAMQHQPVTSTADNLRKVKTVITTTESQSYISHSEETVKESSNGLSSQLTNRTQTKEPHKQCCDIVSMKKTSNCDNWKDVADIKKELHIHPSSVTLRFHQDEGKENTLCEIIEELAACKFMGKEWKRLLNLLRISSASMPITQIARAFLWCILCQNPLQEKKVPHGLTPALYQLFQAMCVLEHRLSLAQDSLRTAVSSAVYTLICQPSTLLRPNMLGCLSAWYVANLSIGEKDENQVLQQGRAFLLDLLWNHPGVVHLALFMALTSGQKFLIRMISTREPSGIEKVLQWVAYHGPWMGAACIRTKLTSYLTNQLGVNKPPTSDPTELLQNFLAKLADSTDIAVSSNLLTSILVLVRWQGKPWIVKHVLPIANSILKTEKETLQQSTPVVLLHILANQIGKLERVLNAGVAAAHDKPDSDIEKLKEALAQLMHMAWGKCTDE